MTKFYRKRVRHHIQGLNFHELFLLSVRRVTVKNLSILKKSSLQLFYYSDNFKTTFKQELKMISKSSRSTTTSKSSGMTPSKSTLSKKARLKTPRTQVSEVSPKASIISKTPADTQSKVDLFANPHRVKIFGSNFEVFGKVQRVFFRKYTQKKANALLLRGWCRNTPDGTVTGRVEGPYVAIKAMHQWLQTTGSPKSRVDKAVVSPAKVIDKYSCEDFEIKQ